MKRYRIDIWQHHRIVEKYESDDIREILRWYMEHWYWTWDRGDCAFDVHDRDGEDFALDYHDLRDLGFYGDEEG